jgi:hypothetical protein
VGKAACLTTYSPNLIENGQQNEATLAAADSSRMIRYAAFTFTLQET